MVDPGDTVSRTLRKEFGEEAMNTLEATTEEKQQIERQINELFKEGHKVREGGREREGEGEREREGGRERERGEEGRERGGVWCHWVCCY